MSDKNFDLKSVFQPIKVERIKRIKARNFDNKKDIEEFTFFLNNFCDEKTRYLGNKYFNKILKLTFTNINVNLFSYHAHLVRVAMLSLKLKPNFSSKIIVPALIHNVIETTNIDEHKLAEIFLKENLEVIKILTVDRDKQHSKKYLDTYYNNILNSYEWVQIIKLVDKIDNMFTLCLNPDSLKREEYLNHIEKYIVPLAKNYSIGLLNYLE